MAKPILESNIRWAEMKFPPINLWVMASLFHNDLPSQGATAHIHRRQRPGSDDVTHRPNALHKLHRRLETLLAVHGGKI